MKAVVVSLALFAACGTEPDSRPASLDYIVDAILAPQCADAGCHTAASQAHHFAFDTVGDTLAAFSNSEQNPDKTGRPLVAPHDSMGSELYQVIAGQRNPMPPAWNLPDADILLIQTWIDDGAPGYTP